MGCTPSSGAGIRHDCFHRSVFPDPVSSSGSDVNDGVWTRPLLQSDYRHSMDLSAFLSPPPPVPPPPPPALTALTALPPDDPPPYTEQLLAGHTTLMHGTKPWFPKENGDDQDLDSTLLSAGDVSVLESSVLSTHIDSLSQRAEEPPIPDTSYIHRQAGVVTMSEPRDIDVWSGNGVIVRSSTPLINLRTHTPRGTNPFNVSPNMSLQSPTQPNFQRPLRSMSLDHSDAYTNGGSRVQPRAGNAMAPVGQFPQRPGSTNPTQDSIIVFPTRPPRLPPLQNTTALESSSQHRKRKKRKRGHSWHGEPVILSTGQRLALSPTTTCAIDSVVE